MSDKAASALVLGAYILGSLAFLAGSTASLIRLLRS